MFDLHPENQSQRQLTAARQLVECTFGTVFDKLFPLLADWPVRPPEPSKWAKYVKAACLLYNWLLSRRPEMKQF